MKFTNSKQHVIKFMSLTISALLVLLSINSVRAEALSDIEKVRAEVAKIIPATSEAKIITTGAENVFQIEFQGAFTYAYVEGDFVLVGDLYDTEKLVNLGTCLLYTSPSPRD